MSLPDDNSCLVDGLGVEGILGDTGLQSAIEKFVQGQPKHVIELELLIGEETISVHTTQQGSTLEQSSGVFLFKSEQLTGCLSELGQSEVHSPDFPLVLEAILAHQLELVIDTLLLERSSRSVECCAV